MKNFSNAKIYIIRSPSTKDVYIGSTLQPLSIRMGKHRQSNNKCSSRHLIVLGDAYIELYEEYPCDNIEQLRAREGHYHRTVKNCINKYIAGRTLAEYYIDNKDKIQEYKLDNKDKISEYQKEYQKEYQLANKDKISEYKSEYYIDNKQKITKNIKEYQLANKDKISKYKKEYQLDNKDKISEYQSEYYIDNKDKIIEHGKEKHSCECGGKYTTWHKTNHEKTLKHQKFIQLSVKILPCPQEF